jgi:hypothetical protein
MVKKMFLMGFVFSIALSFGMAFAGPNLNPGKWEITTETEMVGISMKVPPQTHTQCLTKKDLVPQSKGASQECQISDVKVSGDTVSWKIICSGQGGAMEGTGQITYSGDHMEGTMDMVIKGANMQVKNKISGHRIGACD